MAEPSSAPVPVDQAFEYREAMLTAANFLTTASS